MIALAGLCTVDLVQRVGRQPAPGTKVQSDAVELTAGGPAAGAAVAVAALGGEAVLLTALGSHPLAGLARDDLARHGVRVVDALPEAPGPPPVSAVTVSTSDGERTVVSRNAAASGARASPEMLELARAASAVLVDGHHPELAVAVAAAARGPVVLDAGSPKPVHARLLEYLAVFAASSDYGPVDTLCGNGFHVVRTAGAEPVWWSGAGQGPVLVPAQRARAVDTLGAGDVWHGAFTHHLAELGTDDMPAVIERANRVAAARVERAGARAWIDHL